ncbi:GAF and ANTAR domain-containing protein [Lentzea tibetensis]|uniref:GAF and ANTAR domain-containing protein n=2 Tax=Lentzea tibetensis TaxID=2591470 RepID=A0A563F364_9PSEU|nr:GAF and ANTAR domain-containing protein [Lentzea tibetensis]
MTGTAPSSAQRESRLLQAFVQMADTLVDDYDVVDVLQQLVEHCTELLDATAAGLMLSDQHGGLRVMAYSTEQTQLLELFQLQANEGPCLDCVRTGEPVLVADLSTETHRWPRFAPLAAAEGFVSVHAVPMRLRRDTIGALNLFGRETGLLDDQDLQVVRALADTATIGILQERALHRSEVLTEQLQTALNSRIVIEQAKGVLAFAGNIEMNQAFQALRTYGRNHSSRLVDIARQLVNGELPPDEILTRQSNNASEV